MKLPAFFIGHGGPLNLFATELESYKFWQSFGRRLLDDYITPGHAHSILVVSGHWESDDNVLVNSAENPSIIYDFSDHGEKYYKAKYDCKGSPALAKRVQSLLKESSIDCDLDPSHGLDHGVWVPLFVMLPDAPVPVVQLSMKSNLDAAFHFQLGKALTALREEGVLIIGSGSTLHNLSKRFTSPTTEPWAYEYEAMLNEALTLFEGEQRHDKLMQIMKHPLTETAHPRTEHLIPVYFAAGAAGSDKGKRTLEVFETTNISVSAFEFN